jgi:hypothetical protein
VVKRHKRVSLHFLGKTHYWIQHAFCWYRDVAKRVFSIQFPRESNAHHTCFIARALQLKHEHITSMKSVLSEVQGPAPTTTAAPSVKVAAVLPVFHDGTLVLMQRPQLLALTECFWSCEFLATNTHAKIMLVVLPPPRTILIVTDSMSNRIDLAAAKVNRPPHHAAASR